VHLVGVIKNVFDNMRVHGMEYFPINYCIDIYVM